MTAVDEPKYRALTRDQLAKPKYIKAIFSELVAVCPHCKGRLVPVDDHYWVCPAQPAHGGLIECVTLAQKLLPLVVVPVDTSLPPTQRKTAIEVIRHRVRGYYNYFRRHQMSRRDEIARCLLRKKKKEEKDDPE